MGHIRVSANPFLKIDRRILAESGTSDEVATNLYTLCDEIGPRFAGTEGYRKAAEYVRARFRAYKLDSAELEPFAFTAWRRDKPSTLTLTAPVERDIPCYALPYAAATGEPGVNAGVVDVGKGSPTEMATRRGQIKGRFVLTRGAGVPRQEVYARCEAMGAAGFLMGNGVEGMLLATGSVSHGTGGTIPAVSIPFESAALLERLARKQTPRVRLVTHGTTEPSTSWNVVGELTGCECPDELVIIGGHLDSHDIGPGAFDNATGTVLMMEVARLLAKQRRYLRRTVRFIAFGGEELGLLGSHHHARTHARALRKARFMVNCDTPALGRPRGLAFHRVPKGKAYVTQLAEQMGTEILCQNREHRYSDHYPFILQGVPTAGVAGGPNGPSVRHYAHMAADTADKISITDVRDTAAFLARFLVRAANDESWPRLRRSAAEVKTWR